MTIPLAVGLLDRSGKDIAATLDGKPATGTTVLTVTEAEQSFRFENVASDPVPSLLRGFSAPVKLTAQPRDRLLFLYAHDSDPFARWEAGQQLASQLLLDMAAAHRRGEDAGAGRGFHRRLRADPGGRVAGPGLRRRGAVAARRGLSGGPDDHGRCRRHPRRPQLRPAGDRHPAGRPAARRPMPPITTTAPTNSRRRRRTAGAEEPLPSYLASRPEDAEAIAGDRRSSAPATT